MTCSGRIHSVFIPQRIHEGQDNTNVFIERTHEVPPGARAGAVGLPGGGGGLPSINFLFAQDQTHSAPTPRCTTEKALFRNRYKQFQPVEGAV